MCANAENKHALRARLCKANADRDGQRAVHEHRQRSERPAVRCGGYCGEHKARPAGKHRLLSGDCGLSKLAETLFVYKKTGATRDHAAVGLLQTRQGVCQAIAALSMVILPHLGILARYVCGEGYSGTDWGPHAWNAVWAPNGAWHQVDFTFGLHRKTTPNTFTPPDDLHFRELHRWDEVAQSPALFQNVPGPRKPPAS